ncbi:uncharacterized protein MONOS_10257 [Monocercomonoides exilis]|uniref:uncharacterized protein n=1 Tax=Monocercomonoides exilis TaxID=2049356 RepID=UPI003559D1A0|nr:hypothetical protein MONOS_10257 [Monocercomonoides exilis]|eukprot:MONOS_10257.1-p1 / transcript=MONOS_10257.1 / gene=MONOS_10257 / organism=Monocercomonoides_exilis_PA203 / gene_product=unspecified product / transcript_product=unspecified product / location=Mono_scaffold00459:8974-10183(-) / protein_length=252 / sequence_SO=supercontig / SO=protein_coding / is_pseudo=false
MFTHTNIGKKLSAKIQEIFAEKANYTILRLASAFNSETNVHTKVTLLKCVCHEYSLSQLQDYGFECTKGSYNHAKQNSSSTSFDITPPRKPPQPPSKRKLCYEDEQAFSNFINENTTESCENIYISKCVRKDSTTIIDDNFSIINGEEGMEIDVDPLENYFQESHVSDFSTIDFQNDDGMDITTETHEVSSINSAMDIEEPELISVSGLSHQNQEDESVMNFTNQQTILPESNDESLFIVIEDDSEENTEE